MKVQKKRDHSLDSNQESNSASLALLRLFALDCVSTGVAFRLFERGVALVSGVFFSLFDFTGAGLLAAAALRVVLEVDVFFVPFVPFGSLFRFVIFLCSAFLWRTTVSSLEKFVFVESCFSGNFRVAGVCVSGLVSTEVSSGAIVTDFAVFVGDFCEAGVGVDELDSRRLSPCASFVTLDFCVDFTGDFLGDVIRLVGLDVEVSFSVSFLALSPGC